MGGWSEAQSALLQLQFDRSVKVAFRGSSISSDGGLLLHRELDDALGLTDSMLRRRRKRCARTTGMLGSSWS